MFEPYDETGPGIAEELKRCWQILLRRRYVLLATLAITVISAAVYNRYYTWVPTYQATATVIIESEIPRLSDLDRASAKASNRFYASQYEIIRSYAVAQKAFDMLRLGEDPEFADQADPVGAFRRLFEITPVKGSELVRISASALEPETAAERVNALARAYVLHNLEGQQQASSNASTWLSEQLAVLKAQIEESEDALLNFQAQEDILSLDRRRILLEDELSGWSEKQTSAMIRRLELETLLSELRQLRDQPEALESLPQVLSNNTIQELKSDCFRLELELAQLEKKYKPKHPRIVDLKSRIENARSLVQSEIGKVTQGVEIEYRISLTNEAAVTRSLSELKHRAAKLAQQAIEFGSLKREAETNRQLYDVLLQRMKETDLGSNITSNNVRLVEPARVPITPNGTGRDQIIRLGVAVGLLMGVALCFFLEALDSAVRNEEDAELYLDLPVLGSVPKEKDQQLDSAIFLRAYRDIKTRLGFYAKDHLLRSLLITSSVPGEGKTTTLLELGKAFARAGSRVLLIDADMYCPRLRQLFAIDGESGLTDVVLDDKPAADVIVETSIPGLRVLPSGLLPRNPADVLASEKIQQMLADLKDDFDMVLIESAPLSAGLETASVGSLVDGIAVVVKANSTSRKMVQRAVASLQDLEGNVLGIILCAVDTAAEDLGLYYGQYAPQSEKQERLAL